MGGLRARHAADAHRVPRRRARARRRSRRSPASCRRTRSSPPRSRAAARSAASLYVAGLVGAFLTGLYTFRLSSSSSAASRATLVQRAHARRGHGEGPLSMLVPGRRARRARRRSAAGSQIPGVWQPFRDWLDETSREPLVEPTVARGLRRRAPSRSRSASSASASRWRASTRGRRARHEPAAPGASLEHKLYFDELYDALFYRPAVGARGRAPAQRRGAASSSARSTRSAPGRSSVGGEVARAADRPAAHVRARDRRRASPSSSSSSWRCAERADDRAHPPPVAGALVVWIAAAARARRRPALALLVALVEVGLWIVARRAVRLRRRRPAARRRQREWFDDLGDLVLTSASTASRSGSSG